MIFIILGIKDYFFTWQNLIQIFQCISVNTINFLSTLHRYFYLILFCSIRTSQFLNLSIFNIVSIVYVSMLLRPKLNSISYYTAVIRNDVYIIWEICTIQIIECSVRIIKLYYNSLCTKYWKYYSTWNSW